MYVKQKTPQTFIREYSKETQLLGVTTHPGIPVDKGELHIHLNGAVPKKIVLEILAEEGTEITPDFNLERDLVHLTPCSSLAEYLKPWQVLRRIPKRKENLQRIVNSAMTALDSQGVRFVELRSSVLYLSTLHRCSVPEALSKLITCIDEATQQYKIRRGLILTVTRGSCCSAQLNTILSAYNSLGRPKEIIGIDLAGDEGISYPADLPKLFRRAKDKFGLGVTIHAGETGCPENIRIAVEDFAADRIGHGTAAGSDPWLMEYLAKKNICIEVCPISNRLTGSLASEKPHPLYDFYKNGVPFVICSDNPAIHACGLVDDYMAALAEGLPLVALSEQYAVAKHYSFIKDLS